MASTDLDLGRYQLGWSDAENYVFKPKKGLNEDIVREMSWMKGEPEWMLKFRLRALRNFERKPMLPWFAENMPGIDFQDIYYYIKPTEKQVDAWDELPDAVKQTYEKLGIPEAERKYLAGVTAQYECLRGSTRVWTTTGMGPIKDIHPGEVVFSLDEETKQFVPGVVVGMAASGEKEIFEITARGRTIGASGNHPFLVLRDERQPGRSRRGWAARWIPAEELEVGDLVAIATAVPWFGEPYALDVRPGVDTDAFPRLTSEDFCWWAGIFVGDGYLHDRSGYVSVEIAVDRTDTTLVDEIVRVSRAIFGLEFRLAGDGLRLVAGGTSALAEFLEINGLAGSAHTKRVPGWVYSLPPSERLAFLAGYVDSDGYVRDHAKNRDIVVCSANPSLLEDVKELLALTGVASGAVTQVRNRHLRDAERWLTAYQLHLSGRFDRIPCRSPRRAERLHAGSYNHGYRTAKGTTFTAHTSDMLGFVRIDRIESVGVEPTYDIEVAGHHNFVAEGFVVHNSEVVYHRNREDLEKLGILFTDMDTAVREYPDVVKRWFGTVIPPNDNKFAALNSATWSGGCLTADARINVRGKGLVSIADVEEGDEVFGADVGRNLTRGKVLAKVASGTKPVYRMRVAGRTLEATGNHQFLVARRVDTDGRARWTAQWKPLDEIEIGEAVAVSRELPDDGEPRDLPRPAAYVKNHARAHLVFPSDTSGDLMWLLGLWLGDGHTAAPHEHMRQISFSVPDGDPVKEEARNALWRVFGVDHVTEVACGFVVSSKELGVWLEGLGFAGHAKTKRIPSWVYSLPHYQQLALLGGLVDADGWTERDGATMAIELANRDLLEDVRQLAIGCGLSADGQLTERTRTVELRGGRTVTSTSWRLRVQGNVAEVWTRNPAKAGKPLSKGRATCYTCATDPNFSTLVTDTVGFAVLREKAPIGERPTYDIQVVGLENFVANGIVAHNSFIYVPPGVEVPMPLQAYFRINAENMGQFERTLIIADEGAKVHYIEGCSAPVYTSDSLHSAVVELVALPGSRITYTTIQNWSSNVYNLVTKRGRADAEARIEWIDGNIGSKLTMKYPAVYLMGPKASGEVLSVAYAGAGQHQDAGAKMVHAAPETTSQIVSKSISKDGGATTYRGLVRVEEGAHNVRSHVRCDALILDPDSVSNTRPYMEIGEKDAQIGHEATVSKVGEDQLFYLMSRGLSEEQAMGMIVNGFIEPITRTLPMEFAVELNRLIELNMEGSVG